MGRKRKNGEGTVRLRKDGRWEGRVVIGYDDKGLPKTKNVLAKTKSECVEKLKTLKDALAPPAPPRIKADMPFGDWMEHWYETHSRPAARPGTRRIYEGYLRLYINPGLGHIPLNRLTAKDMQQFFVWLKTEGRADQSDGKTGLTDSQLRNIHSLCWRALEKAVSGNLIPQNPASGCKLPSARKGEMNLLSRESMQKLLIQAKEEKYYELFLLEFATGLRLGELTALQWEDLNLTTGELRISKQAVVIGSELVITEPKTKAAVRTLLLPPKVLEVFREYRKRNVSRWLFPSPKKENSPLLPSVVRQRLHRLLDHAGCERVRFHDLRHPYVKHTTKIFSLRLMDSQAQACFHVAVIQPDHIAVYEHFPRINGKTARSHLLHFTLDHCPFLGSHRNAQHNIPRSVCHLFTVLSAPNKGLGLSQQAKHRQVLFRECGYTPYACYGISLTTITAAQPQFGKPQVNFFKRKTP